MADWLVKIGESEYRAQSVDEVRQWYREGRVTDATQVFHPVQGRWMAARDVEELRGMAAAPGVPLPAAVSGGKKGFFRPKSCLTGCAGLIVLFIVVAIYSGFRDSAKQKESAARDEQKSKENAKARDLALTALKGGGDMPGDLLRRRCEEVGSFDGVDESVRTRCGKAFTDAALDAAKNDDLGTARSLLDKATAAGAAASATQSVTAAIERSERQAEQRKEAAVASMRKEVDKLEGTTWYTDKSSPTAGNTNAFYIYFAEKGDQRWLRWMTRYYADTWLFVHSFTVYADGQSWDYNNVKIERDNNADTWEWHDTTPTARDIEMIRAVIKSKEATIRFHGKQYHDDRPISSTQKKALQRVLDAYQARGGQLP
jgi:hypothetical protein